MRKPLFLLCGALLLTAALTACGAAETAAESPAVQTEETAVAASTDPTDYIGGDADQLLAAIGQPLSTSYASSCIGDGEDGQWDYDGFTVYTYRAPDGTETVEDVLYLDD